METIKEQINRIKQARESMEQATASYQEITTPIIASREALKDAYAILRETNQGRLTRTDECIAFTFIATLLFFPAGFCMRLSGGLRRDISRTLGVYCTSISHYLSKMQVFYDNYIVFRSVVDEAVERIIRELG